MHTHVGWVFFFLMNYGLIFAKQVNHYNFCLFFQLEKSRFISLIYSYLLEPPLSWSASQSVNKGIIYYFILCTGHSFLCVQMRQGVSCSQGCACHSKGKEPLARRCIFLCCFLWCFENSRKERQVGVWFKAANHLIFSIGILRDTCSHSHHLN